MTGQEGLDFSRTIRFENSDPEDQPSELVEVSDQTKSFLEQVSTRRMPNKERLTRQSRYLLPKVPATRTAQLDSFMKPEVSSATKNVDRELAKVQTLILDALAPLTSILEGDNRGERLDQGEVINSTKVAAELLGYASAHVTHARRTKVTSDLNKALLPLVEEDSNFADAPPALFGTEFAQKSKVFVDQVKALRATVSRRDSKSQPFRVPPPPPPPTNRGDLSSPERWSLILPSKGGRRPLLSVSETEFPGQNNTETRSRRRQIKFKCCHKSERYYESYAPVKSKGGTSKHEYCTVKARSPSSSRTAKQTFGQLEVDHQRPVGVKHSTGVFDRVLNQTSTARRPQQPELPVEQIHIVQEEVTKLLQKQAISRVTNPVGVFTPIFFLSRRRTVVRSQ